MRLLSSDVPMRSPIRRRGTVISRRAANLYICNVHGASAGNAAAYWEGIEQIALGRDVTLEYDPANLAWWIMSP